MVFPRRRAFCPLKRTACIAGMFELYHRLQTEHREGEMFELYSLSFVPSRKTKYPNNSTENLLL